VYLVNDKGHDVAATIFDKVVYELHPSFGKRAKQSMLVLYKFRDGIYADSQSPQQRRNLHLKFPRKDGANSRCCLYSRPLAKVKNTVFLTT
jgi:hypothetical protein